MIDIHAHLLPGVDDGPATWDEAIDMVRMAAAEGVTEMVATSHMMPDGAFPNTRDTLLPLIDELRHRVEEARLDVTIHAGGEVYMCPDVLERLEGGKLLTYRDAGQYMLIEMPSQEIPTYAEQIIFDLQLKGITPIIAHPERNHGVMNEPMRAFELVERGALLQMNASSLRSARAVRTAAGFLLKHGLVHFVATDAHGLYSRRPRLGSYRERLSRRVGDTVAGRLISDNPATMLAGEKLDVPVPERPARFNPGAVFARLFARRGHDREA